MDGMQDRRLLVVDDDPSQLRTLTAIMEGEGFEVVGCSTGVGALEQFDGGRIGVAVVDLRLPDIGGIELLERLQHAASGVHVILHTAHSSFESAKRAVNKGAFAYVEKTDDPDELVRHVHRAFQGRLQRYAEALESAVAQRTQELEAALEELTLEIAERKRAEEALRMTKEKYEGLFDDSLAAVYVFDAEMNFIDSNQAGLQLLGYSRKELLGMSAAEVDADPEIVAPAHAQLLCGGKLLNYEHQLKRKDGAVVTVLNNSKPLFDRDHGIVGMQSTLIDITERKRAEEAQRENERRQREAEKLAATGRMAAQVAHEINNPLAGIKNSFRLIRDAVPEDHPDHDMVGRIEREIDRIARVVRQMYKLHSPRAETPTDVPVDETIRDVLAMLEPLCREHEVAIELAPVSPKLTVKAPEGSLQQVMYNLVANAINASPRSGVVNILTEPVDKDYVRISIRDQGPGIPAEVRDRMFEPFFSADPGGGTKEGIGLGLSVVRSIVESFEGRIEFESSIGEGTCFRVYLPSRQP